MSLQRVSVHRPVALSMCVLAALVIGLISLDRIGIDLLPNLEYPTLAVVTVYPNADAESVESDVTLPIERTLSTVSGLRQLESLSMENASLVMATFEWGTDLGDAFEEINSLLSVASLLLPSDVQRPIVVKLDPSQVPVLNIAVTGETDLVALTGRVEREIVPVIERVPGVAQVSVAGGAYPQISVYYDTQALRERARLNPLDIQAMLQYQNAVVPAGTLEVRPEELGLEAGDVRRFPLRVGANLESIDDLRSLVISVEQPATGGDAFGLSALLPPDVIRLGDVAQIVEEVRRVEGHTRVNGEPAVVLRVLKESEANTVEVSRGVLAAVAALTGQLAGDLTLEIVTDQAQFINKSIDNLSWSALVGAVLAVLVLTLFLRSWRDIVVIAVAIPLAFTVAVTLLHFGGYTLNLMTLGGLAIAVGMLVDNAIVVLENIFRLRGLGLSPKEAAVQGASEMAPAIVASTLTTVAVFVPLIFMRSLAGYLFKELSLAVVCALAASLLVALTVVPMLAAYLPDRPRSTARAATSRPAEGVHQGIADRLTPHYARAIRKVLRRPWLGVVIAGAFTISLVFLPRLLDVGFVPEMDGSLVTIDIQLPPGTPLHTTDKVVRDVEAYLEALPEVALLSVQVGNQGGTDYLSIVQEMPVNQARVHALLVPPGERSRSSHELARIIGSELPLPPEAAVRISADRAVDALGDDFAIGLTLEILGPEWDVLQSVAGRIAEELRRTPGFVNVTSTAEDVNQVLFFEVDRVQAGRALLPAGQVGLTVRLALTGLQATTLHVDGRSVPVVIKPSPSETENLEALQSLRVWNLQSDATGIPQAARFEAITTADAPVITDAPRIIRHLDRQRVTTVKAQLDGVDLGKARRLAEQIVAATDLPAGYEVRMAGIHRTLDESIKELVLALGLAVLFVYMVMAAQFESLRYPGIIMITVPLSAAGGFFALWLTGQQLNVPAFLGLLLLVGIAVNNGIVLVDTIGRFRRSLPLEEAIVEACRVRLRPILMTALTTILGLVPLALGWGEGTEIQVPLALAALGGLISGTLLTLFVVPAFYRLFSGTIETPARAD